MSLKTIVEDTDSRGGKKGLENTLYRGVATRAGQSQANEGGDTLHTYELSTGHSEYQDVDGRSASDTFKLWLRATTPTVTSTDQQAAFTVTVTAVTGAGL